MLISFYLQVELLYKLDTVHFSNKRTEHYRIWKAPRSNNGQFFCL